MKRRQKGMTLLEVLVALAVFAVAGMTAMQTANVSIQNLTRLERKTFADWVATNKMVELKLSNEWPGMNWVKGKTEFADTTWYWQWRGIKTEDDQFRALEVEVHETEERESATGYLRSYVSR